MIQLFCSDLLAADRHSQILSWTPFPGDPVVESRQKLVPACDGERKIGRVISAAGRRPLLDLNTYQLNERRLVAVEHPVLSAGAVAVVNLQRGNFVRHCRCSIKQTRLKSPGPTKMKIGMSANGLDDPTTKTDAHRSTIGLNVARHIETLVAGKGRVDAERSDGRRRWRRRRALGS